MQINKCKLCIAMRSMEEMNGYSDETEGGHTHRRVGEGLLEKMIFKLGPVMVMETVFQAEGRASTKALG